MEKKELIRSFKYSALIGIGMLIWLWLEYIAGLHKEHIQYHLYITMIAILIPIVLTAMALRERRTYQSGLLSYKEGFFTGLGIAIIGVPIALLTQWIFHTYINPDFFKDMIAYAEEQGHHESVEYFNLKSYMMQSALGPLIGGTVISAILAFFFRKNSA